MKLKHFGSSEKKYDSDCYNTFLYYIEFSNIRKPRTYLIKPLFSVMLELPESMPRPKKPRSLTALGKRERQFLETKVRSSAVQK